MATRNVVLTNHQSEVVERLVESGRYQNASEVLRTGLRMVEEAESAYLSKMNELREAITQGERDVESGKTRQFTGDEFANYLADRAEHIVKKENGHLSTMEPWKVILTDTALDDLDSILEETLSQFGNLHLRRYTKQIQNALQELEANGLNAPLLKDRDDIQPHLLTYPLARKGKRSPHHLYLRFDVKGSGNSVIILRILHERMDPETQIREAATPQ